MLTLSLYLMRTIGNSTETYKVNDLNVEADATADDYEDDDVDWEEG